MRLGRSVLDELCYAAEGLSGTAGAASLRELAHLMDRAPQGRLFSAISTLTDMSAKAARALEEGSLVLGHDDDTAAARIGMALAHMDGLATLATDGGTVDVTRRARG